MPKGIGRPHTPAERAALSKPKSDRTLSDKGELFRGRIRETFRKEGGSSGKLSASEAKALTERERRE